MRVAICISGQLREFEQAFPSLSKFILEPFKCDVFLNTWHDSGLPGVAEGLATPQGVLEKAHQLYRPVKMVAESWSQVRAGWGDLSFFESRKRTDANVENILAMWYQVWRANELKREAEIAGSFVYDVVIRSRSDVLYFESPEIETQYSNYIYVGNHFGFGGVPDVFAFGESRLMDQYSSLFQQIGRYVQEGCVVHPETLLQWHLATCMPQGVLFSGAPFRVYRGMSGKGPTCWQPKLLRSPLSGGPSERPSGSSD